VKPPLAVLAAGVVVRVAAARALGEGLAVAVVKRFCSAFEELRQYLHIRPMVGWRGVAIGEASNVLGALARADDGDGLGVISPDYELRTISASIHALIFGQIPRLSLPR
jgi:hypothetical protein